VRRRVRRALSRHRLLLVALVLGVGALAAFAATRPPTPATVSVAVVARDLAPGRPLVTADVQAAEADPPLCPTVPSARPTSRTGAWWLPLPAEAKC